MRDTGIEWTEHTWNPVTGCSQVSPGCDNCYALAIAERMRGTKAFPDGFDVTLRPHRLRDPLRWKQPARIFVNSMSDLFHREIPDDFVCQVWATMTAASHHTFQILTKRPHRMSHKLRELGLPTPPHIWLGTSVEDQKRGSSRLGALCEIDTPSRFVSAEPLLAPVTLKGFLGDIGWVIVGGESGKGRRPMDYDWARNIRDECAGAGVRFFYKQGNAFRSGQDRVLDGRTHDDLPPLPHVLALTM